MLDMIGSLGWPAFVPGTTLERHNDTVVLVHIRIAVERLRRHCVELVQPRLGIIIMHWIAFLWHHCLRRHDWLTVCIIAAHLRHGVVVPIHVWRGEVNLLKLTGDWTTLNAHFTIQKGVQYCGVEWFP